MRERGRHVELQVDYAVRHPQSAAVAGLLDQLLGLTPQLRAAWAKAEEATIGVLRDAIADLGDTWRRFGKYFHAFKHGGLVTHRPDFEILRDEAEMIDPAVAVWRLARKTSRRRTGALTNISMSPLWPPSSS